MAVGIKELVIKIIGDSDEFNKAVSESTKRLDDFKKKNKEANELFGIVSKQATIATTAIAAVGIAATKMAVDFNAGFANVQTLIPGAKDRIKELQKEVLDLSPAVGKTTEDLTSGLYEIISAFGDSADSAKNLELAAKGATAGGATTKDSIALLSAVTKAYGDTSNAAQKKVSDLAFTTVKLGQTSYSELAASIQRVTSQSKTLKISQEEMFSVFSSGTGVIGGAAEVSTKFSALLTEMQKPSDGLKKAFKELGVTSGEELIENFGGLQGALQALKGVAEKTGEPISNLFGSAEAGKLALYAAGEGAEKFTSDLNAMQDSLGATEQAFNDATTEGPNAFGFQLQQAGLNAQGFAIKVGQELIPSIQALLNPLFKSIAFLKDLDAQTIKTIVGVGKIIITATAVTAAVMGAKKAFDALKTSMIALKGAFAANPFGLFLVSVTTAIVALKELGEWFDRIKEKQKEAERESLRANLALPKEAESVLALSKAYIELAEKENLTAVEKQNLKTKTEELLKLNPTLFGQLSTEENAYKDNLKVLKKINEEKIKEIELNIRQAKSAQGNIVKTIADNEKHLALLKETNEYKTNAKGDRGEYTNAEQIKKEEEALNDLIEKQKIYAEEIKKNEALLAELKDSKTGLEDTEKPKTDPTVDTDKPKGVSHKEQLEKLDAAYNAEMQIIQNRNINKIQKQEELKKAEEKYYNDRLALLEKFHTENIVKGKTFYQSKEEIVGQSNESIIQETEKTNAQIEKLQTEKHQKEIERLKNTASEAQKIIKDEIALKKELGEFEGNTKKEKERNAKLFEAEKLYEKRNELESEYLKLQNSSNKKDKEKADILKEQIKIIDDAKNEVLKGTSEVEKTFKEMAEKVAAKIQEAGSAIASTFSGITDLAKGIIGNKEAQRQQETAARIAEIERDKNETLLTLDDELAEMREQRQIENAEREEARRDAEYEKRQADYDRNIASLQNSFDIETNKEKIRNMEQQIEAERKKKAEDRLRKKEEKEKAKREKEARRQEVELLNARAMAEHDFAVTRIQTENAAGDASAKAAQEATKWQKAQTAISLSIKAAEQTALSAASFPDPVGIAAHAAAAVLAGVQAGVVLSQPLPPSYTAQPLPPAPRPIKFAFGGIVMPSSAGTGITLPNGTPGIVAEAGVPEMIMPITPPNMEAVFKAAGITNNNQESHSVNYSPSFNIDISQNTGDNLEEKMMSVLREHDRELINIVEDGRKNWAF